MTDGGTQVGAGSETTPHTSGLTDFQKHALATVYSEDLHGLGIKEQLEDYYDEEIGNGRIYPNLDTLVDKGLIEKGSRDRRTNNYSISQKGRRAIEYELDWFSEKLIGGDSDD